jgi:hypothetical protein
MDHEQGRGCLSDSRRRVPSPEASHLADAMPLGRRDWLDRHLRPGRRRGRHGTANTSVRAIMGRPPGMNHTARWLSVAKRRARAFQMRPSSQ